MRIDQKYRLLALLGLVLLFALTFFFFRAARRFGQSQVALGDLPDPVLETVREHVGYDFALLQIDRQTLPRVTTFVVRVTLPDGSSDRLWLAADGSTWPPDRESKDTNEGGGGGR